MVTAPKDRERGTLLFDLRSPAKSLDDIVLSEELRGQVEDVIREYAASPVLETFGLTPRRKLLFAGPPGCGKTLCAEVIASEVGIPLLYTRFDAVISSYLGETAANLRKVFDFAESGTWVVFFDEFDAIGKSRDDVTEHGELKRVVNTFLQLLDGLSSPGLFIAATNHERLLDNALWRRFDDILYFDRPSVGEIRVLIGKKLRGIAHPKLQVDRYVPEMTGWSHADVERVCLDAMKLSVLAGTEAIAPAAFEAAIERQRRRREFIGRSASNA